MLFWFFKSKSGGAPADDAAELSDAERAELLHAMEGPTPALDALPPGYCSTAVRLVLERSCITLATAEDVDLVQVRWDGVYEMRKVAGGDSGPTTELELGIDTFRVEDSTSTSQLYRNIVDNLAPGGEAQSSKALGPLDLPRAVVVDDHGSEGDPVSFRQLARQLSGGLGPSHQVYVPAAGAEARHRVEDLVDLEDVTNMVDSEIEELAAYLKSQICQVERGNSQAVLVSMTLAPRGSPNSVTLRVPRPLQVIYNPVI